MVKLDREKNVETLRQAALLLEHENKRLIARNVELQRELHQLKGVDPETMQLRLAKLEALLAQRTQKIFGDSSERRAREDGTPNSEEPKTPKTGHGPREQPELPLVEVEHSLDEADKACPKCGGGLTEIDGQFEESEEVTVIERRFVITKHKLKKYRCRCNACIETALGPEKLIAGGRYSIDFAIEVATQKYLDHLPLERQVRIMAREGLIIDSQTLWDQIRALARRLEGLYQALRQSILAAPVIGGDETHWRLMGANGRDEGESKRWQIWTIASPNAVFYQMHDTRGTRAARELYGGYRGVVMTDGYAVYEALAKESPGFLLAHCWAHVRRKFVEIETAFPLESTEAIALIGELYEVERECPAGEVGDAMRAQLRHGNRCTTPRTSGVARGIASLCA